jgi:hypothetical protein
LNEPDESRSGIRARADLLAWALAIGVGAFLLLTPLRDNLTGDAVRYMGLANAIADGEGYVFNFRPHTRFPPGTPILLAAVRGVVGGGYDQFLATMAIFAFLSLISAHVLLATLGHPRLGVVAVLVISASPVFYARATQAVGSDYPFFFFCLSALTAAVRAESERTMTLVRSVLLAALVVAALMIRGAGLALLGALCLWIPLRFVRGPRPTRRQLAVFLPAVAAGVLYQATWWWWQSLNRIAYWPGEFMNSYFSQLLLKDPNVPELGPARLADLGARAAANAVSHAAHVSELLTNLPWIDPRWYSPFVVLPVLLVSVGLVRSMWERVGIAELFFVLYAGLYLLWPFDEGIRYTLPVFPLLLLYAWQGLLHLDAWAARDVRRALKCASAAAAAILFSGLVSAYRGPTLGGQAVAAMLTWLTVCVAAAVGARARDPLHRALDIRAMTVRAAWALFAVAITAGLFQEISLARRNLRSDLSLLVHQRSVEAARWLQRRLEPGESAMAGQEAIVHYVTGYRVIPLPVTSDAKVLRDTISRYNVRYLVIYRDERNPYFLPTEEERLAILRREYPEIVSLAIETETYRIYAVAVSGQKNTLELVRESQGEGDDRQRRIDMARCRKDGASRHIEIVDVVEPAVSVDDSPGGRRRHAGRSHVVVVIPQVAIPVGPPVEKPVGGAEVAEIEAAELERHRPGENGERASIQLG